MDFFPILVANYTLALGVQLQRTDLQQVGDWSRAKPLLYHSKQTFPRLFNTNGCDSGFCEEVRTNIPLIKEHFNAKRSINIYII